MMLARVADSLYWIGRYLERAEHLSRVSAVMLNAALDRADLAGEATQMALAALGDSKPGRLALPVESARALALDREREGSVVVSLSRARENARQVRDQITTEVWERLNMLYLRVVDVRANRAFNADAPGFLQETIADLHLVMGAVGATMSHGEGWRFMGAGTHIERAQLMARLLKVHFDKSLQPAADDHLALVTLLRMACALEPYLRVYTADVAARHILEFLLFNEEFPRSIRFSTGCIEDHLGHLARGREGYCGEPLRLAGRLNARLAYAVVEDVEAMGAGALLATVESECATIHQALHDTFIDYPLESRLPA